MLVPFQTRGFLGIAYTMRYLKRKDIESMFVGNSHIALRMRDGTCFYNWKPTNEERNQILLLSHDKPEPVRWDMPSPDPIAIEILKELK